MVIKNKGEEFSYKETTYKIGDLVIANGNSVYNSLYGIITEIRTDVDKETENPTIDIYCNFQLPPTLTESYTKFLNNFPDSDGSFLNIEQVIMAPEMIDICRRKENDDFVYIVQEKWSSLGENNEDLKVYKSYDKAKYIYNQLLQEEISNGIISSNNCEKGMSIFEGDNFFIAQNNDILVADYYKIHLIKAPLFN